MANCSYMVRQQGSGIYYFRIVVPERHRAWLGVREVRRSLGVREIRLARPMALLAAVEFNKLFLAADNQPQSPSTAPMFPIDIKNLTGLTVELKNSTGATLKAESDPNSARDAELLERVVREFMGRGANNAPSNIQSVSKSRTSKDIPQTIVELLDGWRKVCLKQWSGKTGVEYDAIAKRFSDFVGTKTISTINSSDVSRYIEAQVEAGVKLGTVGKHLNVIKSLFTYAVTKHSFPGNLPLPTVGQVRESKKSRERNARQNSWLAFDSDDLTRLFDPQNYQRQNTKPHEFWMPILGLLSASRIEELSQLTVDDVKKIDDIWFFDINERDRGKHLKSAAATRLVPLHPQIIQCGFLDYVRDVRLIVGEQGRIFPYLRDYLINGLSDVPSEAFKRYRMAVGVVHGKKVFHSFRKTANDRLKQNGVGEDIRSELLGHEYDSVNSTHYTLDLSLAGKQSILTDKLKFPEIDFTKIRYQADQLLPILKRELARRKSFLRNKQAKEKLVKNKQAADRQRGTLNK